MTFTEIFEAYYNLYRAEADTPATTDDEYTIALRLANEAVSQWDGYDNTYWKELFTTNLLDGGGSTTVVTDQTDYDVSDNFKEAGGFVKIKDSNGNTVRNYAIIEPEQVQFQGDNTHYAYFLGNPSEGYVLKLNPAPDSALSGMKIDYVYYKTPTLFTTGNDVTEMKDPYFIVHRMLGNRFRASRNPYYQSALRDAEDALSQMKMSNDSGTFANPWKVTDTSGSIWGADTSLGRW